MSDMNTSEFPASSPVNTVAMLSPPALDDLSGLSASDRRVVRQVLDRSRQYLGCSAAQVSTGERPLRVRWARHADEVRAAQRLRHIVFAGELGAQLHCPPGTPEGLDVDRFDAACEHLLVTAMATDAEPECVVGTYRMLTPDGARRTGGLYSDEEFDLAPLERLRPRMAELGRSCTHPHWRRGGVVMMLWGALAERLQLHGLSHVMGCASVSMRDGGRNAHALWRSLQGSVLINPELRVRPWLGLPIQSTEDAGSVQVPPLVKGYLRCGARLLGAPAWDPDFQVADLPLLLATADLPEGMRRRQQRAH